MLAYLWLIPTPRSEGTFFDSYYFGRYLKRRERTHIPLLTMYYLLPRIGTSTSHSLHTSSLSLSFLPISNTCMVCSPKRIGPCSLLSEGISTYVNLIIEFTGISAYLRHSWLPWAWPKKKKSNPLTFFLLSHPCSTMRKFQELSSMTI